MVTLAGFISNDVASAPGDPIGNRPLATSLSAGTCFIAYDSPSPFICQPHPFDATKRIWRALGSNQRTYRGTAAAAGATQFHCGMYDPNTGVFTQATVAGQFCNAIASTAAAGLATMLVSLGPCTPTISTVGAGGLTGGQQFMTDNAGNAVVYVPGAGVIPLGVAPGTINAGDLQILIWYDW